MNVPSIEDLMNSQEEDIRKRKARLANKDTTPAEADKLRREIKTLEEALNGCRARVREEKIDEILPEWNTARE